MGKGFQMQNLESNLDDNESDFYVKDDKYVGLSPEV